MSQTWGVVGHNIVSTVAARRLPDEVPAFLRKSVTELEVLGDLPDHWKIQELPALRGARDADHFLALERLPSGFNYPSDRHKFVEQLTRQNAGISGYVAASVGLLPYAITETYQELVAQLASWRVETAGHGQGSPLAVALERTAVHAAGLLGHYVADAAQPLHTSVHFDGWDQKVEPRPEFASVGRGIHARFETDYVSAWVDRDRVFARVGVGQPAVADAFVESLRFIGDSHARVEPIYRLAAGGGVDPSKPDAGTTVLAEERLAAGAQFLTNLWASAWQESANLAQHLPIPR